MFGKTVPIQLGGKTRNLKYGFNALVDLETSLGIPIQGLLQVLTTKATLKDMRAILWVGLIHEDKTLTPEDVGNMIESLSDYEAIGVAVKTAIEAAFPAPEPKATIPGRKRGASKNSLVPR